MAWRKNIYDSHIFYVYLGKVRQVVGVGETCMFLQLKFEENCKTVKF